MRALVNYKSFEPGERFQEIVLQQINRPSGSISGLKCTLVTNFDQFTANTKETPTTNGKTECYTIKSENTETTYVIKFTGIENLLN